jgi:hypothetical protein
LRLQELTDQDVTLRVEVADTGMGVAPHKQQVIFEEFVQADASTTRRTAPKRTRRLPDEDVHGRGCLQQRWQRGDAGQAALVLTTAPPGGIQCADQGLS